jgi:hypothetical protein
MTRLRSVFLVLAVLAGCTERAAPDAGRTSGTSAEAPGETVAASGEAAAAQSVFPGRDGGDLVAAIRADYTPERTLGYDRARDLLFAYEMRTAGHLRDPYTGWEVALPPGDPSTVAYDLTITTEHTWPQSKGARDEPLRSDLHHLYPVQDRVNSSRGNLPFGEVPDAQAEAWYTLAEAQSRPPEDHAERWSERGAGRFEPRDDGKGDVARAVFYVYAVYGPSVADDGGDAFFSTMRADLLEWTRIDPVSPAEAARAAWIATQQGTPNPFVLDPTLAARAFGAGVPDVPGPVRAGPAGSPGDAPAPGPSAEGLWMSALHYDNAGEDRGEGVGLSGLPGARLAGWTLVLVNGPAGTVYRTVPLSGSLDGDGRAFVGVDGMQNGPADGVALVAPGGAVAEFVSYEGTVTATEGPAAGRESTDIGAAEDGRVAPGTLLLRSSRRGAWRLGTR